MVIHEPQSWLRGPSPSLCGHDLRRRHRRVRFVVGLDSYRRRTCLVVVEPIWSYIAHIAQFWATSTSRWAVRVIVGVNMSSMGHMFRRWAVCFIDGLYVSLMGRTFRRRALSVAVGRYLSSTGGLCYRWAVGRAVGDFVGL